MTVNTKTNGIMKSLAEISEVSNPNLLDNPDFRVNMRGNSSYSKYGMTVNIWMLSNNDSITITPKLNSGITFNAPKASPTELYQKLETPIIGKATLSIKVSSISGQLDYFASGGTSRSIKTPGVYSITVEGTADKPITEVSISAFNSNMSTTADIDWVKLELGEVNTQFVRPNYDEEYTKLLWYSRPIVNGARHAVITDGIIFITVPEIAQMRISKPSVIYGSYTMYLYCNGSFTNISHEYISSANVDNYKEVALVLKDSYKSIISNYARHSCTICFVNNAETNNGFWLDAELY